MPPELREFAQRAASIWSPAAAFTLDVTRDSVDVPRIVEANCINGSGLYRVDALAWGHSLAQFQQSRWPGG